MLLIEITKTTLLNYYTQFLGVKYDEQKQVICEKVFKELALDECEYKKHGATLAHPSAGLNLLTLYRLAREIVKMLPLTQQEYLHFLTHYKNYCLSNYYGYIHPKSYIGCGVVFKGVLYEIGENVTIKQNCILNSNIHINDDINNKNVTNYTIIDNNCTIGNNVIICGKIHVGENVNICDNAIIRENIESNTKVEIVNQLQLKQNLKSVLPSQKLQIYGVTKKYKNTLIIHGEGFYNPKIIMRDSNAKELNCEISYWDKNKIMIKLKYAKYTDAQIKGTALVVMSNGTKITLLNNIAVENMLKNLCE